MEPAARARLIHDSLPVVDGHNDLPWKLRTLFGGDLTRADPGSHLEDLHTDIPRLLEGGVGGQFWSVFVPADIEEPFRLTLDQIDLLEQMVAADDRLAFAETAADLDRLPSTGKIACLLGAEGGHCIEGSLDNLAQLRGRGVRYLTLTHSDTIHWADSATDEPRHGGLTEFGRAVVREMNSLGMIVDISHVSTDTMWDALEASDAPVIASHSGAAALAPHPRNVPDDVLRELGARGGVVMVPFFPGFLVRATALQMREMFGVWRRVRSELAGDEAAIAAELDRLEAQLDIDLGGVEEVADHIEHIAEVAGLDAVGIGSDFDGMSLTPRGLEDVSCYPAVTEELLTRGWEEPDVRKVLGGNIKRVLGAVEARAG